MSGAVTASSASRAVQTDLFPVHHAKSLARGVEEKEAQQGKSYFHR